MQQMMRMRMTMTMMMKNRMERVYGGASSSSHMVCKRGKDHASVHSLESVDLSSLLLLLESDSCVLSL
jgi:hypothetical protein